jgi:hypothetical protein
MGLETLLNLLSFGTPYQALQADFKEIANRSREEAYALLALSYAWAGLGIFVVTGRKL